MSAARSVRSLVALGAVVLVGLVASGCKPKPGAACSSDGEARCMDPTAALICHERVWTPMQCRGPKGCNASGALIDCDESSAQASDFCDQDGNYSCSTDRRTQLRCVKSKWVADTRCAGPKGCVTTTLKVECDDTIASVGDVCSKERHHTCSQDRKAVLICKGGAFVQAQSCLNKTTCEISGDEVGCR